MGGLFDEILYFEIKEFLYAAEEITEKSYMYHVYHTLVFCSSVFSSTTAQL